MKPIKLKNLAVFVGRFQPFHVGHYSIVEKILAEHERLILVIGSAEKSGTEDNPWTLEEREEIIRASIPLELQERMDIVGLDDTADDDIWGENLQVLLPSEVILFTGNEWVRSICEKHGIQTDWIDSYQIDISGTKIREMIQRGEDVSNWTVL